MKAVTFEFVSDTVPFSCRPVGDDILEEANRGPGRAPYPSAVSSDLDVYSLSPDWAEGASCLTAA